MEMHPWNQLHPVQKEQVNQFNAFTKQLLLKGQAESGHHEERAHLARSSAQHLLLLQHEEEEREKSAWWMEVQWRVSFCSC